MARSPGTEGAGVDRLAEEQAALRRVATLVAKAAAPAEVFEAVVAEVVRLLPADAASLNRYDGDALITIGSWSSAEGYSALGDRQELGSGTLGRMVRDTGQAARVQSYAEATGPLAEALRARGWRSSVGAPVIVEGRLWGVMAVASTTDRPLPPGTEVRLAAFTELAGTAIGNAQSREELTRLVEQQAALRRVATVVAQELPPQTLFAVVAEEVARVLGTPLVSIVRYESDGTATERASFSEGGEAFPAGTRWSLDGTNALVQVREHGQPARIDDYSGLQGEIAENARRVGIRSTVGIPIHVAGSRWGALVASSTETQPLPQDTEPRLADFADLVATAISNTEAHAEAARLAAEQAALRRVATLVAEGVPPSEVFDAATVEAGTLLGADLAGMVRYEGDHMVTPVAAWAAVGEHPPLPESWPTEEGDPARLITETLGPVRIEDWERVPGPIAAFVRELGISSSVGSPIIVEGRLWGALAVHSKRTERLPADTESRLRDFTDLIATAMSNAQARGEVHRLADEQAALRRVATLVAHDVPPERLFGAVAKEVGMLLDTDLAGMIRYENEEMVSAVATWAAVGEHADVSGRWSLEGDRLATTISRTGKPTREDAWDEVPGPIAAFVRETLGIRSSVGCPVIVEGRVWGALFVHSTHVEPLPADAEARLLNFTELIATAISNAQARGEVRRLADEQAALRRVATLVAQGVPAGELFAAVAKEAGTLLGLDATRIARYEGTEEIVQLGAWSKPGYEVPWFDRAKLEEASVASEVLRTGRVARIDDYERIEDRPSFTRDLDVKSSVGAPIVVGSGLWGVMAAWSVSEALPRNAGDRLTDFTELVATAIANTEAQTEVTRLAEEQAALRLVATLVAGEASSEDVFAAVAHELGQLLEVQACTLFRYEADGTAIVMADWGEQGALFEVGTRMTLEGENVTALVLKTKRPARIEDSRSAVGCPIIVKGRLWGAIVASIRAPRPMPPGIEDRIGQFTELVATAISNMQARADLAASRARIVTATDETRRRFERDLHDGVQQRLVSLSLEVRNAEAMRPDGHPKLMEQLDRIGDGLDGVVEDLRELSRGLHPAILSEGGLGPALRALARRSAVPIKLDVDINRRYAERLEVASYYVVCEALANAAKHAQASATEIHVEAREGVLDLRIHDDGVGGADPARGSGLTGLADRVEALGGTIAIASPAGGGTSLHVRLPVEADTSSG